ncbi:MAG: hypothetical protein ACD_5C00347G0010 [uncultured bacterium]|nr:MAG: hypothetical protein ACD_5C00347G0010 [uncultured bacterium]
MKTSSKIALAIFLLALVGLGVWGFFTLGDRFIGTDADRETKQEKKINNAENNNDASSDSADEIFTEDPVLEDEEAVDDTEEDTFLQVLPQDCENECKSYQQEEDVTYCKQVCGLVEIKKEATGCDALADLEKDYCLKDEAISKADPKICDKIEDGKIKKTCKNRILEDIVDKQMQLE